MDETFDIVIGTKGIATIAILDFLLVALFFHVWGRSDLAGIWRLIGVGSVGVVCVIFLWFTIGAVSSKLIVSDDVLVISIPMYGKTLALADVDIEGISVITADERNHFRPAVRTNGLGLPGYGVGWFRLRNGSRALVAVGSRGPSIHIPTSLGFSILATIENPDSFVELLASTTPIETSL